MPSNRAAYLAKPKTTTPLEVGDAPYTPPKAHEVVVKNHALAINPVDWMKAGPMYDMIYDWIKLPFIQGTDHAGEVVEVGPLVTRFKPGNRVFSLATGPNKEYNTSAKSAFQLYTVCLDYMTTQIPDSMSYEQAAVIPLGAATASCALFDPDQLRLQYPTIPRKPTGKTVFIWGGSTSVGCNTIQLAVAAGYDVLTTCSPKNFELCKRLGARQCFDYNSRTVVSEVIEALRGVDLAGAVSIGVNSDAACFEIVQHCKGNKFVSMVSYPSLQPAPANLKLLRTILFFASWYISTTIKTKMRGIGWKFVFATTLVQNGVGKAVYEDYLPRALADGLYHAAPEPEVVGTGLDSLQTGYDCQQKGMTAKKVVVSL